MEFSEIKGFPDYLLYQDGRIFSIKNQSFLNCGKDSIGYIQANLKSSNGKRYTKRLHRLLAEHFIPKKEGDGDIVDHIDNNRINNLLNNLRWSTPQENGKNTSAKKRDTYCIRFNESRNWYEINIPQDNGCSKYIGHADSLENAKKIRDNALIGNFLTIKRSDTYCITKRSESQFEVSIPINVRKYKYIGSAKTLDEAKKIRDNAINERDSINENWKPKFKGPGVIKTDL